MMLLYLKIDRNSPYSLKNGADLWEGKGTVEDDNNPTPCQLAGLEIQKKTPIPKICIVVILLSNLKAVKVIKVQTIKQHRESDTC